MSKKQCILTPNASRPEGLFSPVVRYGDLLFLAGQTGRNPVDKTLPKGMAAQTRSSLENVRALLETAGSGLDKVLSVTVYITDMGKKAEMNEVYKEFFPTEPPVRTTVGVNDLDAGVEVEITVIAGVD